jgi:hypothetical protein
MLCELAECNIGQSFFIPICGPSMLPFRRLADEQDSVGWASWLSRNSTWLDVAPMILGQAIPPMTLMPLRDLEILQGCGHEDSPAGTVESVLLADSY